MIARLCSFLVLVYALGFILFGVTLGRPAKPEIRTDATIVITGGSGRIEHAMKALEAGNGEWGGAMHTDLLDAKRWAVSQGYARIDQVCLFGASYGGYATMAALALSPGEFACGISFAGMSDLILHRESKGANWLFRGLWARRVGTVDLRPGCEPFESPTCEPAGGSVDATEMSGVAQVRDPFADSRPDPGRIDGYGVAAPVARLPRYRGVATAGAARQRSGPLVRYPTAREWVDA